MTLRAHPSETFIQFAEPLGLVVTEYDRWAQLLLVPSLIAAKGRARSFKNYLREDGASFGVAECFYLDGSVCDARAARHNDQFCITIFDAVAYQMLDLCSLALACPRFFTEIGDPSKEDLARVKARKKPAGYGFFRKAEKEPFQINGDLAHPLCPIRSQAALYFTGMALDAIWSHELAHAFMGHVDYAKAQMGMRALNETPNGDSDLRQMPLEAEADRFSCATLVQSAFTPVPYLPKDLHNLDRKTRLKAGFVVTALLTWFWAFQQRIDRTFDGVDPYAQGSHPPPLARLHLGFDGGRDMLKNLRWQDQNIQFAVFDAMSELEELAEAKEWFSILHPKRSFDKKSNAFVRDIKTVLGDIFKAEMIALESFRFKGNPDATRPQ